MENEKVLDDTQEEEVVAPEESTEQLDTDEVEESSSEDEDNADTSEEIPDEEKKEVKPKPAPEKPKQSAEENAKWAQRRREAETKAKESTDKIKAILKPFNAASYEELDAMVDVEIDSETKKRLIAEALEKGVDETDYIERWQDKQFIKLTKAKEAARIAKAEESKALKSRAETDKLEFEEKYPEVNVNELMKNEQFMDYADGKLGRKSLFEIYKGYKKFTGEDKAEAVQKSVSKAERSTSTGKSVATYTLSPAQAAMLKKWNEDNPDMKMTAKDFFKN